MVATIVSAFISNVNNYRTSETYLEYGKILLSVPVYKIIFLDESFTDFSKSFINEYNHFIYINKNSLKWYKYKNDCNLFIQKNNKDTLEYLIIQLNKNKWVLDATKINPFNTNTFIWIDFGIYHMCSMSPELFTKEIIRISEKNIENIYIPIVKPFFYLNKNNQQQLLNNVIWFFAGSIFSGNPKYIKQFYKLTKHKIKMIINHFHTLTWEINVWYFIYNDYPHLFNCYYCDHNNSILLNY
uniref:Uncharacterized protein n=1 Tax=viral metagenome TaxID=1070528 RepID=A0A6C0H649_9ZZZZ